ncbi:MAG TPA: Crp/Fnr family transcriptional regulator [Ferruginibacter sp.]|jgi:CRP-like cAMP-binding protein|nr:Crp/Fnr family transcriptional regulator [Ferruginibacter sp.]
MSEVFKKYLAEKSIINEDEFKLIMSLSTLKNIKRREYLLKEGSVWKLNVFICKGCLRLYRKSNDGTENIMQFAIESWWIGDRESLTTGLPSKCNIDALEDTEVLIWTKDDYDYLLSKIPELRAFKERLLARSFDSSQNRVHTAISFTAEEKIQKFKDDYSEIYNRVPLHMVASYLGITRETLSRITNRIEKK